MEYAYRLPHATTIERPEPPVRPSGKCCDGAVVLITGGTGSLGHALTKRLLGEAKKIIIFSRGEYAQVQMRREFQDDKRLRFFVGDVRDRHRLYRALAGVDYVFHAAALKHVDVCHYNPFEAVETNINGAHNLIDAAIDCGVRKVLAVSSDKACNPCNLYGYTKATADHLFVSARAYAGASGTRFSTIRFGNFIGSRGSVLEYFDGLARTTGELPITSFEMTRFWIALDDAAERAIEALNEMEGGEIFTPKMEHSKLVDFIAERYPGCRLTEVGIRPGEKLHEDLVSSMDAYKTVDAGDWYITYSDGRGKGEPVPPDFNYNSSGGGA